MLRGSDFPFYSIREERLKVDHLVRSEERGVILEGSARQLFNV